MPNRNNDLKNYLNALNITTLPPKRDEIIKALQELAVINTTDTTNPSNTGVFQFQTAVKKNQEILTGAKPFDAPTNEAPEQTGAGTGVFLYNDITPDPISVLQHLAAQKLVSFSLNKLMNDDAALDAIINATVGDPLRQLIGDNPLLGQLSNTQAYGVNKTLLFPDTFLTQIQTEAKKLRFEKVQKHVQKTHDEMQVINRAFETAHSKIMAADWVNKKHEEKKADLDEAQKHFALLKRKSQELTTYYTTPPVSELVTKCAPGSGATTALKNTAVALVSFAHGSKFADIKNKLTPIIDNFAGTPPTLAPSPVGTDEEKAGLTFEFLQKEYITAKYAHTLLIEDPALDPTKPERIELDNKMGAISDHVFTQQLVYFEEKTKNFIKKSEELQRKFASNFDSLTDAQRRGERRQLMEEYKKLYEDQKPIINEFHRLKAKNFDATNPRKRVLEANETKFQNIMDTLKTNQTTLSDIHKHFRAEILLQQRREQGLMSVFQSDEVTSRYAPVTTPTALEVRDAEIRAAETAAAAHAGQITPVPSTKQGELLDRNQCVRSRAVFDKDRTGIIELDIIPDKLDKAKTSAKVIDRTDYENKTFEPEERAQMAIKHAEMILSHYNPKAGAIRIGGKDPEQVAKLHAALLLLRPNKKIEIINSCNNGPTEARFLGFQSTQDEAFIHTQFDINIIDTIKASDSMKKAIELQIEANTMKAEGDDPEIYAGMSYGPP